MEDKIKQFKDKKVLILGLGVNGGGLGATKFFAKAGSQVRVTDLKTEKELKSSLDQLEEFPGITYILGKHQEEDIDWADLIVRNQGIKPDNKYLQYALSKDKHVEMDCGIFLQLVSTKQMIAVTGTKGKSTTSSLIHSAINEQFPNTVFAGNIGVGVLDSIDHIDQETKVVLELSSFQLEAFEQHKTSPHIAVITNIFEDHLNYYSSMEEYAEAKRVIAKYQTKNDYLFINRDDKVVNTKEFLNGLESNIVEFSVDNLPPDFKPTLPGEHNLLNYAAALKVASVINIPKEEALLAMNQFGGVEFRTQLIKKINGIKIYNDTTATNPGAAIASLKAFPSCILICGGQNANMNYQTLADTIDKYAKAVFFLDGDATDELKKHIKHKNIQRSTYTDFNHLLNDVRLEAKEGDTILLSPGAKSFNLFQNEFDRGRKFNAAVEKIFS